MPRHNREKTAAEPRGLKGLKGLWVGGDRLLIFPITFNVKCKSTDHLSLFYHYIKVTLSN